MLSQIPVRMRTVPENQLEHVVDRDEFVRKIRSYEPEKVVPVLRTYLAQHPPAAGTQDEKVWRIFIITLAGLDDPKTDLTIMSSYRQSMDWLQDFSESLTYAETR